MRCRAFTKISLLFLVIFVAFFTGFSKEKIVESAWISTPVNVDGLGNDWAEGSLNFEKKVKVDYGFKNDADNLYVIFLFKDRKFMSTLRLTGLTLWFNTEGKTKKVYGIKFKDRQITADQLIARLENQHGTMPEARKKEFKANPSYFIYSGEVIDKKGNILTQDALAGKTDEPIFRMKPSKERTMNYELKIPLKTLEKLSADYAMEPGKMVKIGFEWGGLTKELQEAKARQQAAGGVRAGEGSGKVSDKEGHAGISAERSDGSQKGFSSMASLRAGAKRYSFWVDVKLAQNQ